MSQQARRNGALQLQQRALVVDLRNAHQVFSEWQEDSGNDKGRTEVDDARLTMCVDDDVVPHVAMQDTSDSKLQQNRPQRGEERTVQRRAADLQTVAPLHVLQQQAVPTDASNQSGDAFDVSQPSIGGDLPPRHESARDAAEKRRTGAIVLQDGTLPLEIHQTKTGGRPSTGAENSSLAPSLFRVREDHASDCMLGQMTGTEAAPTLALVVITLNEEANIGRCLASVSGLAHQMVVVDSESSDRTRELAEAAGAEVVIQKFLGYGPQKQFAAEKARSDWLLFLDADEWLDDEARNAIRAVLQAPPSDDVTGFRLRMSTFYLGRWMRHAGWLRESKLRLVRRGRARWKPDIVHESLELTSGRCKSLPGSILHLPYRDLSDQLRKIDRYSDFISIRDRDAGLLRIWFGLLFEPPLVFLQKYFLQLGFLDGPQGFLGASLMAFDFFLRFAKIGAQRIESQIR